MKKTKIYSLKGILALVCVCAIAITLCSCDSLFDTCDHIYLGEYVIHEQNHIPVCDSCGELGESEMHKFGEMVTLSEPTDTADGEGYYECYTCGHRKTKVIHDFVKVEYVSPTCGSIGSYEHYKCASCDKLFDSHYDEIEERDINISSKEHSATNPNPEVIEAPTPSSTGLIKLRCDRFEICGGYVSHNHKTIEIVLPKLEPAENYTVVSGEGGNSVLRIKEEYVKSYLEKTISSDIYRSRIATVVAEIDFDYYSCEALGHQFSETSFVNENNKLFYVCKRDPSHKLEIELPTIESGAYTRYKHYANCVRSEGYQYHLGESSWTTILRNYENELIAEGSTVKAYARALADGFYLFVSNGGEPNPNNHINNDMVAVKKITLPTYDVLSGGAPTTGKADCFCGDCETKFTVDIDYSSGQWRKGGNILDYKYYRDYSLYGKTFSTAAREGFNYRIDTNGGTAKEGVWLDGSTEVNLDEAARSSPRVIIDDFTRTGYELTGVTVYVDYSISGADRITKGTVGLFENKRTCWDIDMDTSKYMGDVIIKLQWTKVY